MKRISPALLLIVLLAVLGALGYRYRGLLTRVAFGTLLAVTGGCAVAGFSCGAITIVRWLWRKPLPKPPAETVEDLARQTIAMDVAALSEPKTELIAAPGELPEIKGDNIAST